MVKKSDTTLFDLINKLNRNAVADYIHRDIEIVNKNNKNSKSNYSIFLENINTIFENVYNLHNEYLKDPFLKDSDMILTADFDIFKNIKHNEYIIFATNNLENPIP